MAFVYGDRVKETSVSVGIGPMVLGGSTAGFQSFADGVGVGNDTFYGIVNTVDNTWEMGRGTVGVGSLTRNLVFSSSNAGGFVNFAPGDKIVYTTVPADFFDGALDSAKHELEDHTVPPLSLLNATAHQAIDHTAAPLNLLTSGAHDLIDHTAAPFNLLDSTAHQGVDHTAAPFNLLDSAAHSAIDHTAGPLFLLDTAAHGLTDHNGINNTWRSTFLPQVTVPERTAGTETALRSFAPADISAMAAIFGGGGGSSFQVAIFAPTTFAWTQTSTAISTGALAFTPSVAIAFASFRHQNAGVGEGNATSIAVGVATATNSYSHGVCDENTSDGNDSKVTYASGAISGFSALGGGVPYNSAWDLATVNVNSFGAGGIELQPSTTITGNLTLIVMGSA